MLPFYPKVAAEEDAPGYGPTMSDMEKCGTCRFFRPTDSGTGYCDKFKFICQEDFVCESWEAGERSKAAQVEDRSSSTGSSITNPAEELGETIVERGTDSVDLARDIASGKISPATLKKARQKRLLPDRAEKTLQLGEKAVGLFYPKKGQKTASVSSIARKAALPVVAGTAGLVVGKKKGKKEGLRTGYVVGGRTGYLTGKKRGYAQGVEQARRSQIAKRLQHLEDSHKKSAGVFMGQRAIMQKSRENSKGWKKNPMKLLYNFDHKKTKTTGLFGGQGNPSAVTAYPEMGKTALLGAGVRVKDLDDKGAFGVNLGFPYGVSLDYRLANEQELSPTIGYGLLGPHVGVSYKKKKGTAKEELLALKHRAELEHLSQKKTASVKIASSQSRLDSIARKAQYQASRARSTIRHHEAKLKGLDVELSKARRNLYSSIRRAGENRAAQVRNKSLAAAGAATLGGGYLAYKHHQKKAASLKDFVGGLNPMAADPAIAGADAERAALEESEHLRKKQLAMAGGAVGGGVLVPTGTAALVGAAKGAVTGRGVRDRLARAGAGAAATTRALASRGAGPALAAGGAIGAQGAGSQYDTGRNVAILTADED